MNLEHTIQQMMAEGFSSIADRECSKKIFPLITRYVSQFYGNREPQDRQKDLIVTLTAFVDLLKIPDEEKTKYFTQYNKIAQKFNMPQVNYDLIKAEM